MKILFTSTYYLPYISGMTVYEERLAIALKDRGHTVNLLTSLYDKKLLAAENRNGIIVARVPIIKRISKGFIMPLYIYYCWKEIGKVDIVIAHLPQFESLITAVTAKLQKKSFYCVYHCELVLPNGVINKIIQIIIDTVHLLTFVFANRIITYSDDYARHSRILPIFKNKVVAIYPPIPIPQIDIKEKQKLIELLPKKPKYIIGVAARFAAEKGFEYLFSAIPLLKKKIGFNFIIAIAGQNHPVGEEAYWHKMQSILKQYNNHIIFFRNIAPDKMGAFYSLLDVLVLPSINATEAFGMVQVEAMFCGVPVVASDLPGVRVPVQMTGMGELALPKNSQDLAEKIVKVLTLKKHYIKTRKSIEKVFSFNDTITEYEKILTGASW
jgi:glycosyltransferase involved in cell wall biosynthesis